MIWWKCIRCTFDRICQWIFALMDWYIHTLLAPLLPFTNLQNLMPTANFMCSLYISCFWWQAKSLSIDLIFDLELELISSRANRFRLHENHGNIITVDNNQQKHNMMQQYDRNVALHLHHNWTVNLIWRTQPQNEVTNCAAQCALIFIPHFWYICIILISIFAVIRECPFYIILSSFGRSLLYMFMQCHSIHQHPSSTTTRTSTTKY